MVEETDHLPGIVNAAVTVNGIVIVTVIVTTLTAVVTAEMPGRGHVAEVNVKGTTGTGVVRKGKRYMCEKNL